MGQLVLSAVGAVVGFYLGGPEGAAVGWSVGSMAGGLLFPQNNQPDLHDLKVQNSAYGQPIPWMYGKYRVSGNVIWCGPVSTHVQEHSSKGSLGKTSTTDYSMSIGIALCEGVIQSVSRIWANSTLIYDVTNPADFEMLAGSLNMVTDFTVYPGDELQMPDPGMEAQYGVGNVSPMRGLAYIVLNDFQLSPYGNYIPSFSFEVVKDGNPYWGTATQFIPNPAGGGLGQAMPYMQPNGGKYFQGSNAGGGFGMTQWTINPYGAFPDTGSVPVGGVVVAGVSYDSYGCLISDGSWWADGTPQYSIAAHPGLIDAGSTVWIKSNNIFYVTFGSGIPGIFSYVPGGASFNDQYVSSDAFALAAITTDFLYAFNGSTLQKFSLDLDYIADVFTDSRVGGLGYAVSDTEMYFSNGGGNVYKWDGTSVTDTGAPAFASSILTAGGLWKFGESFYQPVHSGEYGLQISTPYTEGQIPLSNIVTDVCTRAGVPSFDASGLTDVVNGYVVGSHGSGRDALSQLLSCYFVDVSDSSGTLKFVRRGQSPSVNIPYGALGASNNPTDTNALNPITKSLKMSLELPLSITLTYASMSNDYNNNSQIAFRTQTTSNNQTTVTIAAAFGDADARQRAETMLWAAWINSEQILFNTDLTYLDFDTTDVIEITGVDGRIYLLRITKISFDGKAMLAFTAVVEVPEIYPLPNSVTVAPGLPLGFVPQTVGYSGSTLLAIMDIPPLQDTDSGQGLYIAASGYAANWPGVSVESSRDGTTFTESLSITAASPIGVVQNTLGNFTGGNQPDELNELQISLYSGSLNSIDYTDFLNQVNAALVGSELILFRNAVLTSANNYTLNGLLRGRVGTEWAMAGHVANERFVFLSPNALASFNLNVTDLKSTMYFEPQTLSTAASDSNIPVTSTTNVARVKPLSPVYFRALHATPAGTTHVTLAWLRRARVYGEWTDGTDVPLDESTESYQLAISNSAGVLVRTVMVVGPFSAANEPNYVYDPSIDSFSAGQVINFSVAQNSDQGILGYPVTTSIIW